MSGLLNSVDSFDSFLVECFRVPSSTNNNNDLIELTCDSVVESAVDFDLSLLGPVVEGESVVETVLMAVSIGAVLCWDSMKLRISEIEDLLGAHQFAFWRTSTSVAVPLIVSLCQKELGLQIGEADFILVRELDLRWYGVLPRVTTVVRKRQILAAKNIFKLRGYFVDLAQVFLAKVRLLSTEIANHLFEGQRCSQAARTRRVRGTHGGHSQGRARNEAFAAHYLAFLEQVAMMHQELASDRAAELLSLVDAHVATSAARNCLHWPPSSAVCLGQVTVIM